MRHEDDYSTHEPIIASHEVCCEYRSLASLSDRQRDASTPGISQVKSLAIVATRPPSSSPRSCYMQGARSLGRIAGPYLDSVCVVGVGLIAAKVGGVQQVDGPLLAACDDVVLVLQNDGA